MRRAGQSIGLLLLLAASLAGSGCGKYGPPQRVRPAPAAASDPQRLPSEDPLAPDFMDPDEPLSEELAEDPAGE